MQVQGGEQKLPIRGISRLRPERRIRTACCGRAFALPQQRGRLHDPGGLELCRPLWVIEYLGIIEYLVGLLDWICTGGRRSSEGERQTEEQIPLYHMPSPQLDSHGQPMYELLNNDVDPQDNAIFISQGAIYDRTKELLGESDHGLVLFRHLLDNRLFTRTHSHDATPTVFYLKITAGQNYFF